VQPIQCCVFLTPSGLASLLQKHKGYNAFSRQSDEIPVCFLSPFPAALPPRNGADDFSPAQFVNRSLLM